MTNLFYGHNRGPLSLYLPQGGIGRSAQVHDHGYQPGTIDGIATTPVINSSEVCIIGVNKMVERPTVRHGRVEVATMMKLSASFDHRVVDGWDGASFIQRVKALLETLALLFVGPCNAGVEHELVVLDPTARARRCVVP